MITFKDMTFCATGTNDCANVYCPRFLTKTLTRQAQELDLPIAYSDFSEGCDKYLPRRDPKRDSTNEN